MHDFAVQNQKYRSKQKRFIGPVNSADYNSNFRYHFRQIQDLILLSKVFSFSQLVRGTKSLPKIYDNLSILRGSSTRLLTKVTKQLKKGWQKSSPLSLPEYNLIIQRHQ